MHPIYNQARRIARARVMGIKYGRKPTTKHTDASPYLQRPAHAVCVTSSTGQEMTCLTVRTTQTETAEEVAIALAATISEDVITVLADSQAAGRTYLRGRISKTALRILETKGQLPKI